MQFVGANAEAQVSGADELATRANYFKGSDASRWLTDVPTFARVNYREVYPGIDLEFYGNAEKKSEYDFIVKPEADASRIELDFVGAGKVEIDAATGELLIHTAAGTIKQTKPFSYQESADGAKSEIRSGYEKSGATNVRFHVGDYDRTKPLVIDPALGNLAFSSYLGGAGDDGGASIKTEAAGNVYVAGYTRSDLFPTTSGVFDTTYNGSYDAFVTKMSADGGSLIFSTYIGGNSYDFCDSITIDAAGSIYLTGNSASFNYPTTAGAYDTTINGVPDVVATKLNATGNQLIYSTFLGGNSDNFGYGIVADSSGNAFITGYTQSNNFPTTTGAYDTTHNGGFDAFVTKLNPGGTALVYSTFLGSNSTDGSLGIAIDTAGNAVITGQTASSNFPTTAVAYDTTYNGSVDAFVTKLNAAGNALVFSTFLGGNGDDYGLGVALDSPGNVYLTGYTTGGTPPFPTTPGAYDTTLNGFTDAFVSKLAANGAFLTYSTFLGGNGDDTGAAITIDSSGSAYITGQSLSTNFPTTANAYDASYNGNYDAFVSKLNPAGSGLSYSTYLGESQLDASTSIALDSANNIYVTGNTRSSAFPTTANAFQTEWAGGIDAFVAKFGNFVINGRTTDVSGAAVPNATIALSGSSSEIKLTDANGNFAFLDALPNRAYTVSASRAGTVFNPSLFNISNLDDNRFLNFIAGGAPSGGGSGGNLFFSANAYATNESDNTATVRVWRDLQTVNNSVSVNYATSNGTANAGSDYQTSSGTLTFAPGETEKTFIVPINDDVSVEGAETVNLALSNPTGGATLGLSNATLSINDNGEPQMQTIGYGLGIVASGGVFKGRHIAGLAAHSGDGTIYVAADNNFIEPPTGLTNNCGTQPVQSSFDLFSIAPNGAITFIGNYQIPHRALVNLEYFEGRLYTVGTDRRVYRINPANGTVDVFNSDVGFDTGRYGLEADSTGSLILMRYGTPNSFYRVLAGSGATFLGSYANDSFANFGDRFGIQPDGDYVIYSDAPVARNPREFEIDTTGHIDGTPYNFAYLSTSNIRTLGSGFINSNGAIIPTSGGVFTSGGNCAAGSSVILRTPANGTTSGIFINNIGNGYTDGADNYNARGVTDLDFGARRDGVSGPCLYFADDYNDVIYQACGFAPTSATVSVSGRVNVANKKNGLPKAFVYLTDQSGQTRTAQTNEFGFYLFDDVRVGETYILSVFTKGYTFAPQVVTISDGITDLNFIATP